VSQRPVARTAAPEWFPGDPIEVKDKDNRKGRAAPTAGQTARADEVDARVRWNEFGTPAMLTSTGTPLAEGLPADPVAAAQTFVSTNRELLGATEFRVLACAVTGAVDCADAADFSPVFTSPADAFPSVAPRPCAPELILRTFDIPDTRATHLRLEVVTNQCTGAPEYAGEQDADPRANTDCTTASSQALIVRAAEFQAFAG
jgi:hypothetical protein